MLYYNRSDSQQVISVWHDIPLYVRDEGEKCTGHLNFVCEIPRCSRKKFEIATDEVGNPIKQDTKKGLLREFKKVCTGLFCMRASILTDSFSNVVGCCLVHHTAFFSSLVHCIPPPKWSGLLF